MRLLRLVVLSSLLVACHRSVEVRGLYVAQAGGGYFFPCDQVKTVWHVADTALASRYRAKATQVFQPLFVRLRGVKSDSGGVYGSARHFQVEQILELRPRGEGECPRVTDAQGAVP